MSVVITESLSSSISKKIGTLRKVVVRAVAITVAWLLYLPRGVVHLIQSRLHHCLVSMHRNAVVAIERWGLRVIKRIKCKSA